MFEDIIWHNVEKVEYFCKALLYVQKHDIVFTIFKYNKRIMQKKKKKNY